MKSFPPCCSVCGVGHSSENTHKCREKVSVACEFDSQHCLPELSSEAERSDRNLGHFLSGVHRMNSHTCCSGHALYSSASRPSCLEFLISNSLVLNLFYNSLFQFFVLILPAFLFTQFKYIFLTGDLKQ